MIVVYLKEGDHHAFNLARTIKKFREELYVLLPKRRDALLSDWEKYLPEHQTSVTVPSPSHVMRDFSRLVGEIGTSAAAPITRGIPQGRQKGETQPPRPHQPIVYKKLRY